MLLLTRRQEMLCWVHHVSVFPKKYISAVGVRAAVVEVLFFSGKTRGSSHTDFQGGIHRHQVSLDYRQ